MNNYKTRKFLISTALLTLSCYPAYAMAATPTDNQQGVSVTVTHIPKKISPETLNVITEKDIENSGAADVYDLLKKMTSMNVGPSDHIGHNVGIRGMNNNHTLILINGERMAGEDISRTQNIFELDRIPLTDIKEIKVISGAQSAIYGSDALGGVIDITTKDNEENKTTLEFNTGTMYTGEGLHHSFIASPKFNGNVDIHLTKNRKVDNSGGSYMFFGPRQSYNFRGKYSIDPNHNLVMNLGYYHEHSTNEFADEPIGFYMSHDKTEQFHNKRFNSSLTYNGQNENSNYHLRVSYSKLDKDTEINNYPYKLPMPPGMGGRPGVGVVGHGGPAGGPPPGVAGHGGPAGGPPPGVAGHGGPAGGPPPGVAGHGGPAGGPPPGVVGHGGPAGGPPPGVAGHGNPAGGPPPFVMKPPTKFSWDKNNYKLFDIDGEKVMALGEKSVLTFGANYRQRKVSGTRINSPDATEITRTGNGETVSKKYGKRNQYSYGTYVEDSIQINPKLALIGTLRYDHNSNFGGKTTYRAGSIYTFDKKNKLKFNYGTAYKAPTLSELYFDMEHAQSVMTIHIIGNPNLKPEQAKNWDLSYELTDKNFTSKLTYFDNKVDNLLDTKMINGFPNMLFEYDNVNKARIKGIEWSLVHELNDKWQVRFNNTWLHAKDELTNKELDYRAHYKGALQLLFDDHKAKGFTGGLTLNLVRKYPWTETVGHGPMAKEVKHYETYNTVDFVIAKNIAKGKVYFGIDNLFNKKIEDIGIIGRLWKVGANWDI